MREKGGAREEKGFWESTGILRSFVGAGKCVEGCASEKLARGMSETEGTRHRRGRPFGGTAGMRPGLRLRGGVRAKAGLNGCGAAVLLVRRVACVRKERRERDLSKVRKRYSEVGDEEGRKKLVGRGIEKYAGSAGCSGKMRRERARRQRESEKSVRGIDGACISLRREEVGQKEESICEKCRRGKYFCKVQKRYGTAHGGCACKGEESNVDGARGEKILVEERAREREGEEWMARGQRESEKSARGITVLVFRFGEEGLDRRRNRFAGSVRRGKYFCKVRKRYGTTHGGCASMGEENAMLMKQEKRKFRWRGDKERENK